VGKKKENDEPIPDDAYGGGCDQGGDHNPVRAAMGPSGARNAEKTTAEQPGIACFFNQDKNGYSSTQAPEFQPVPVGV
jgi:hypothetical protein